MATVVIQKPVKLELDASKNYIFEPSTNPKLQIQHQLLVNYQVANSGLPNLDKHFLLVITGFEDDPAHDGGPESKLKRTINLGKLNPKLKWDPEKEDIKVIPYEAHFTVSSGNYNLTITDLNIQTSDQDDIILEYLRSVEKFGSKILFEVKLVLIQD